MTLRLAAGALALAGGPLLLALGLHLGVDPLALEAARPLVHRDDGHVGANACRACHADHWESWARTFHRTMTQRATPTTILGRFDGERFDYAGQSARFLRDGDRFVMELPDGAGPMRRAEIALATGSRRYQQYFERIDDPRGFAYRRLPLLWHVASERWMHLNTVFLAPDSPDWSLHRATWNENCLFCHTTAPKPGLVGFGTHAPGDEHAFDTEVAELGIACEACHGPGAEHVRNHRSPRARRRERANATPAADVVNPLELDPERAVSLCGQCHGQRLPKPLAAIERYVQSGPTFRPGARLEDHVFPIVRTTSLPWRGEADELALRFWRDGSPRLTAYEYQGLVASACFLEGGATCSSCHTMHGGDPRGMILPSMRGNDACAGCHPGHARDLRGHTKHEPIRSGSLCYDCHMPRIVYGILGIHRSHRIESPDPARDVEAGRPEICTSCHVDRSPQWAAAEMRRLWGKPWRDPVRRASGAAVDLPEGLAELLAGDAVERAVMATQMGRSEIPLEPRRKAELVAALAFTLGDGYPSVRHLARESLLRLDAEIGLGLEGILRDWPHGAPPEERLAVAWAVLDRLRERGATRFDPPIGGLLSPAFEIDLVAATALTDLQSDRIIAIGE